MSHSITNTMNKFYDVMVTTSHSKRDKMTELYWEIMTDFVGDIPTESYV